MYKEEAADVCIVGGGIAAYIAAAELCEHRNVRILTKSHRNNSNSMKAQGGIAAAVSSCDHWQHHLEDTLTAGAFHNDESLVRRLVENGPSMIEQLIKNGMIFDCDHTGQPALGMEGAHRYSRILHAGGDATGANLMAFLEKQLAGKVQFIEYQYVVDLLIDQGRCVGLNVLDEQEELLHMYASTVVLATGGCGSIYPYTSNDPSIIGDGIAAAFRAGAKLADLEFIQFHPTLLATNSQTVGLVSEAVRGEGAYLVTNTGERLMQDAHPLGDLAPRDVVARQIYYALMEGKEVFLDISGVADFSNRFPTITQLCQSNQLHIEANLLPVAPGAHFLMGGIMTNEHGETTIEGLYAIGETACTGVHGANRLASNSLLEGIVFGSACGAHIRNRELPKPVCSSLTIKQAQSAVCTNLPTKEQIQTVMMKHVGIIREKQSLCEAKQWFEQYLPIIEQSPLNLSKKDWEAVNMLTVGWLITTSALMRTESRGAHYRSDVPFEQKQWMKKRIVRSVAEFNRMKPCGTGGRSS